MKNCFEYKKWLWVKYFLNSSVLFIKMTFKFKAGVILLNNPQRI